jgi:tRNA (cmo5U34)-methyltransferase
MSNERNRDNLYSRPRPVIDEFVFDESVAAVFPDMINRSVPAYASIVRMTGILCQQYMQPDTRCYDLGCSLGATTLAMEPAVAQKRGRLIAIDNSQPMLGQLQHRIAGNFPVIETVLADIRDANIEEASFVALNFTLQFVPPEERLSLLTKIRHGMLQKGCLVLSEKVRFDEEDENRIQDELHTLFKRANGYSDLEISQKRAALENVLIRETVEQHQARLKDAGFGRVYQWFQCFNFVSLVALND